MLCYIEEYGEYVEITGYRNVKFDRAEEFLKTSRKQTQQSVCFQFFNAELIATCEHLYFAVLNALRAFQDKTNISKSLAMETMLYASAQRQIQKAIQRCGIKQEAASMAVVIIGERPREIDNLLQAVTVHVGAELDEGVLEVTRLKEKKIKEVFRITDEELRAVVKDGDWEGAIVNLIIERVALLATQL